MLELKVLLYFILMAVISMFLITLIVCWPDKKILRNTPFIPELLTNIKFCIKQKQYWYIFMVCIVLWTILGAIVWWLHYLYVTY